MPWAIEFRALGGPISCLAGPIRGEHLRANSSETNPSNPDTPKVPKTGRKPAPRLARARPDSADKNDA